MKEHLFARLLRAGGRLLLFVGTILGIGIVLVQSYIFLHHLFNPSEPQKTVQSIVQVAENASSTNYEVTPIRVIAIIACFAIVILLFMLIAKIYNNHIRSIIGKLARLFHAKIFTVEIMSTLIVWTIATTYFLITLPDASIAMVLALIVNELLFVLAWGAYGQPDYKK